MLFALVYQLSLKYWIIEDNNAERLFPRAVSYLVNFICFMTVMVSICRSTSLERNLRDILIT